MRALTAGLIALIVTAIAASGFARAQSGFDRLGADYTSAPVSNGDPSVCASRCERDKNCRSWSFAYPSMTGEAAMCWLKREVAPRVQSSCCVSGVRGAGVIEPRLGEVEYSIDRVGGDYRSFDTSLDASGKACAAACQADNRCRAWTYRRPGYGITTPHCYLKESVKTPRHKPCCISGVVR